jgi:hypothetical protein
VRTCSHAGVPGHMLRCGVCVVHFDSADRQPLLLPCGHSYCRACAADLLAEGVAAAAVAGQQQQGLAVCPRRCAARLAPGTMDVEQLALNYTVLEAVAFSGGDLMARLKCLGLRCGREEALVVPPGLMSMFRGVVEQPCTAYDVHTGVLAGRFKVKDGRGPGAVGP